jgi:uncharacterized protein (UPF0332 family)
MSIGPNDRQNLIQYRIEQAEETITDVQLLIDNNRLRSAVNRIYYGIFYSLMALGIAHKYETSKHSQLIGWFNKNFIKEGVIPPKYGKIAQKAFNHRTEGDYEAYVEFEKETIRQMHSEMKEFISYIKRYLELE